MNPYKPNNIPLKIGFIERVMVYTSDLIGENWWLNGSVRWIGIRTTAEISFDDGSKVSGDVDPFVFSIKVGYVF